MYFRIKLTALVILKFFRYKVILKKLILRLLKNPQKNRQNFSFFLISFDLSNGFSNFKTIQHRLQKLHLVHVQSKLFEKLFLSH